MTITRSKTAAAVIAAGLAAAVILEFVSNARLREENHLLSEQVAQLNQTRGDSEQSLKAQPSPPQPLAEEQLRELLRLRGEVGVLRRGLAEAPKAWERNTQGPPQPQPQNNAFERQRQIATARLSYPKDWMLAFSQYADQNQGQCPIRFDQAAAFLPDRAKNETNFAPDQFEIVYQGSLNDLTNRHNIIVIRQKEAEQQEEGGGSIRAYGFADGHSEVHRATDGNFGPWEEQHRQKPAGQ